MLGIIVTRRRRALLLAGVALAAATMAVAAIVGGGTASAQGGGTVNVTLAEWSITPEPGVIETGDVTFVATNAGERVHEMVVLQSAFAPDALPLDGDEEFVLEDQVNVIARTERIGSGGTASLTLTLTPGYYTLICNLANHYAQGQRVSLLVTEVGVDPASLPNTGSGGLADRGGGASPVGIAGLAALAVVALSVGVRFSLRAARARRSA